MWKLAYYQVPGNLRCDPTLREQPTSNSHMKVNAGLLLAPCRSTVRTAQDLGTIQQPEMLRPTTCTLHWTECSSTNPQANQDNSKHQHMMIMKCGAACLTSW